MQLVVLEGEVGAGPGLEPLECLGGGAGGAAREAVDGKEVEAVGSLALVIVPLTKKKIKSTCSSEQCRSIFHLVDGVSDFGEPVHVDSRTGAPLAAADRKEVPTTRRTMPEIFTAMVD